ncbi:MAG TPA: hypothetical protein VFQ61_28930, partial [Polyangiaceae bacterium]|nr:hypothetical protein [Polyangiaceae bacterium]
MSRKTKREKQRARRALDYRATMSLHGDALQVAPYVDQAAAIEKRVATPTQGANGEVTVYDVTC